MPSHRQGKELGIVLVEITRIVLDLLILIIKLFYVGIVNIVDSIAVKRKPVKGEIVLITGAGHGIGKELALLYASEGATVVVWDINEQNGNETVKRIQQSGYPKAHFYLCDVSKRENVLRVAKQTQKEVGDVTILINNAGIMPTHELLDHTSEEIERIMNINVMAHFWTLEAFLPTMKDHNHGHIVCLSSMAGLLGLSNLVPYCAAKFAVRGLMEALGEELRQDRLNQIKLTTIYPYMVDTGLCKNPHMRFDNLMPLVDPKMAAKAIMDAQRRNIADRSIPSGLSVLVSLLRLFPKKSQEYIMDFVNCGVYSDLS